MSHLLFGLGFQQQVSLSCVVPCRAWVCSCLLSYPEHQDAPRNPSEGGAVPYAEGKNMCLMWVLTIIAKFLARDFTNIELYDNEELQVECGLDALGHRGANHHVT